MGLAEEDKVGLVVVKEVFEVEDIPAEAFNIPSQSNKGINWGKRGRICGWGKRSFSYRS